MNLISSLNTIMKIVLGNFNAKVVREDIFKQILWNKTLHKISNDNGVRVVNFTTKNLTTKSTMFSHHNIHKYAWMSLDGKTHNRIRHILIDRQRMSEHSEQQTVQRWTFPFLWVPELYPCFNHSNSVLTPTQLLLSQEDSPQTNSPYTTREGHLSTIDPPVQ
jgi:hypothetical protein